MKIWTVGTSNRSIEEFLHLLMAYKIEVIADVRRFPTSRHRHFKQEVLKETLNRCGIEYNHIIELGGYRTGGYRQYMRTEDFEKGLLRLEQLATSRRVAIMCAELLFFRCHRRFIADALTERGHTVIHIIDEQRSYEHKRRNDKQKSLYEAIGDYSISEK